MSNYAWVCFDCRSTARRPGHAINVRCASCGRPCECLGYKIPVPPKSKLKTWEALRESYFHWKREWVLEHALRQTKHIHYLEQEIARLESRPANIGRQKAISILKKRLEHARR